MKTAVIICEYNPFHTGHKYHFDKIREELGSDTAIIAIMSGNFVQRGECAIIDKSVRARCAVTAGADLVLELPFPYSMASAEFFAAAGVQIANEIKLADYLSFGSECGDISALRTVAEAMLSDRYKSELLKLMSDAEKSNSGYPALSEQAYKNAFGDSIGVEFSPNNILALEYLKSLMLTKSSISPHTVKRIGADYNDSEIVEKAHQSASAIRILMKDSINSALDYIPDICKSAMLEGIEAGELPCDGERLSSAVISFFRLNPTTANDIHDAVGGLYNRLHKASLEATTISSLTNLAATKKFTMARVRRAMWFSYFGVTSSEMRSLPRYTQALAMNDVGKALLKRIKKISDFPILTKPSFSDFGDEEAARQKKAADRADMLFQLTKPKPHSAAFALITTPFIGGAKS